MRFTDIGASGITRLDIIDKVKYGNEKLVVAERKPINFIPHYTANRTHNNKEIIFLAGITESGAKATVVITNIDIYFDIFDSDSILETSTNQFQEYEYGVIPDPCNEFSKRIADFKTPHVISIKYMIQKVANAGLQRYEKKLCARLYFSTIKFKRALMDIAYRRKDFYVTSNSLKIGAIFAKENKNLGYWMSLTNYIGVCREGEENRYRYTRGPYTEPHITKADFCFTLKMKDYIKPEFYPPINNVTMSFDIETCQLPGTESKEIINDNSVIFNIGMTIRGHILHKINIYYTIDGEYQESLEIPGCINICCRNEKQVLLSYAFIMERYQPDVIFNYNGGGFDIPAIMYRARLNNVFDKMFAKSSIYYTDSYDEKNIKKAGKYTYQVNLHGYTNWYKVQTNNYVHRIGAQMPWKFSNSLGRCKIENGTDFEYHYWSPPGSIMIDMYMICMRQYPKENSKKLDAFLKKFYIPAKLDMGYAEIWRHWRGNDFEGLKAVFEYCVYDAEACHILSQRMMTIEYNRELSNLTHLPMFETIYQAGTSKVDNYTIKLASHDNYVMIEDTVYHDRRKYGLEIPKHLRHHIPNHKIDNKGALVIIHKPGKVYTKYPIPDSIKHLSDVEIYEKYGFESDGEYLSLIMPVEANDFKSLYPNIIITFNLAMDKITQNKDEMIPGVDYRRLHEPDMPDEIGGKNIIIMDHKQDPSKMGIIPKALIELGVMRVQAVAEVGKASAIIKKYRSAVIAKDGTPQEQEDFIDQECSKIPEYVEAFNNKNVYNAKQGSIKIIMNTYYGATSYYLDILFNYIVAYLTTKYGRDYLTHCNKFTVKQGCTLCYNDTDSVYFHHPISLFEDIIHKYLDGKIARTDYDRKMVLRSMKNTLTGKQQEEWYKNKPEKLAQIRYPGYMPYNDRLNAHFQKLSGYSYLMMVREETLYPVIFCALKKYCGFQFANEYKPNPVLSDVLLKGISIVSRASSQFIKSFIEKTVLHILGSYKIDVYEDLIGYLNQAIAEVTSGKHPVSHYSMHARYKPNTANVAKSVVLNMKHIHDRTLDPVLKEMTKTPDDLEVVSYVCVETDNIVDLKYRVTKSDRKKKTSRCWFTSVAEYKQQPLDYPEIIKSILSTCAQFMTYKTDFPFYDEDLTVKEYKMLIKRNLEETCDQIFKRQPSAIRYQEQMEFIRSMKKKSPKLYLNWVERDIHEPNIKIVLDHFWNIAKNPTHKILSICERLPYKGGAGNVTDKALRKSYDDILAEQEYIDELYRTIKDAFNNALCEWAKKGEMGIMPDLNNIIFDKPRIHNLFRKMLKYWNDHGAYNAN